MMTGLLPGRCPPGRVLGDRATAGLALLVLLDLAHRAIQVGAGPFPLHSDALIYWDLGKALAETGSLAAGNPSGFRTPLYPGWLALFQYAFAGWALEVAVIAQNLLGVLTSLLIGRLCVTVSEASWSAPAGYGISALCVGRIQYDQQVMTESLFIFLLTVHLWALWTSVRRPSARWGVAAGLALGGAALTRPVAALLVIAEVVALLLAVKGSARRRLLVPLTALAVCAGLPMAAWSLRNEVLFGQVVLFRSGGISAWEHTFRLSGAGLDLGQEARSALPADIDWRNGWQVSAALREAGAGSGRAEEWMRGTAASARREQGGRYLRALARNFLRFWCDVEEAHPFYPRSGRSSSGAYNGQRTLHVRWLVDPALPLLRFLYRYPPGGQLLISVAGALGALLLALRPGPARPLGFLGLAWMVYFSVVTVLAIYPLYRFRMVLQPIVIVVGVCAVAALLARRGSLPRPEAAPASSPGAR